MIGWAPPAEANSSVPAEVVVPDVAIVPVNVLFALLSTQVPTPALVRLSTAAPPLAMTPPKVLLPVFEPPSVMVVVALTCRGVLMVMVFAALELLF